MSKDSLKNRLNKFLNPPFEETYNCYGIWRQELTELLNQKYNVPNHVKNHVDAFGNDFEKQFKNKFSKKINHLIAAKELVNESIFL